MRVTNRQIADIFNETADLIDIDGENPFKVRAYRNAARTILSHPRNMADLLEEQFDLTSLKGIGRELAKKITEIVQTGKLSYLEKLKRIHPPGIEKLLKIPGLGPRRVRLLHEFLHINSLHDLENALRQDKLQSVPGFGPKLIEMIEKELKKRRYKQKRYPLSEADSVSRWLLETLCSAKGLIEIEVAGSIRRRSETVHDIDIVAAAETENDIMEHFTTLPEAERVLMKGPTRSSVILINGITVDLRVVPAENFGAALHHFTGSKAHNIALRKLAITKEMKINEYGIYKKGKRIGGEKEEDIYKKLDMDYIVPELRENRGEIVVAQQHRLPSLVSEEEIQGDLHMHTTYSDGTNTIREMALRAKEKGYEYIAVTDHTRHLAVAHGLDEKKAKKQLEEIDRLNEELQGITILKSAEVDILEDGSLDLPESILKELDLTVCAVHFKFDLSQQAQTKRILKAMEHPFFTILGHPTGRLIGLRDPYDIDMEAIIHAAAQCGCILELNAQPDRLDLNDIHCKMAKEAGVPIAISTDAHSVNDLDLMHYGIGQARRGWLGKENVVNTRSLKELKKVLKK